MIVTSVKTDIITAGSTSLTNLLDTAINTLEEGSIVAITSKVVSLCEGSVIPAATADREQLIVQESSYYLPVEHSKYGHHFTITNNTLIPAAGIDASNGGGDYVLWPKDPQATAVAAWHYLRTRFGVQNVGVIITDSTCHPMRRGTMGITLAYCGFKALKNYIGQPDLFGKPFSVSQADVAGGLTAAAVLQMGEGAEQTPLAIITDVSFVEFQDRTPNSEELAETTIPLEEDLFAPFLQNVPWQKGGKAA